MQRGFKTQSEAWAVDLRRALDLNPQDPLAAEQLASHLGVFLVGPHDIPGMDAVTLWQLLSTDPSSWSALTISVGDQPVIIRNTEHAKTRQQSDLMHELAHLLCKHEPSMVLQISEFPYPLRDYDEEQEAEASWLGGCLQLPRPALLWAARRQLSEAAMVLHFGASVDLIRYRRQVTGVTRQLATFRSRR